MVRCRLLFADRNNFIVWTGNSEYSADSAGGYEVRIKPDGIERIIISRKGHFWSGAGTGFLIGLGTGIVVGLASGNDQSGFIKFSAGEKAFVLGSMLGLSGALVGGVVGELQGIDDEYVFNGHRNRYLNALPKLKEIAMFKSSPPPEFGKYLAEQYESSPENSGGVSEGDEPSSGLPVSRFHILVSGVFQVYGPAGGNITSAFNSSGFGGTVGGWFGPTTYPVDKGTIFSGSVSADYNLTRNVQVGLAWTGIPRQSLEGRDWETESSSGDSYALVFTLVPSPSDVMLGSRSEFSFGAGVTYNVSHIDGTVNSIFGSAYSQAPVHYHEGVDLFGLLARVSYDYYLTRNVSVQCRLYGNFIPSKVNVGQVNYVNPVDGTTKTLSAHSVDLSGLGISAGVRLHF